MGRLHTCTLCGNPCSEAVASVIVESMLVSVPVRMCTHKPCVERQGGTVIEHRVPARPKP